MTIGGAMSGRPKISTTNHTNHTNGAVESRTIGFPPPEDAPQIFPDPFVWFVWFVVPFFKRT
jgi:hypothetical protein